MVSKFKAIGFDWGGVIFVSPGKRFPDAAAELLGITRDEFHRAYYLHNHIFNKGSASYAGVAHMWHLVLKELHQEDRWEEFLDFLRSRPPAKVDERIIQLIQHLKTQGYELGLLSNNSLSGAAEARKIDLNRLFDVSLFSAEMGFMKPEPEAFQRFAKKLGVDLSELIYIDDAQKSLSTAEALGYQPILYVGFENLLERLEALDILPHDASSVLKSLDK